MNTAQRLFLLTCSLTLTGFAGAVLSSPASASGAGAATGAPGIQARYEKLCASCHASDGKGNPKKATVLKIDAARLDLSREEAKGLSRDEKKAILLEGREKMPAYAKKLKPEEVEPMLDYVAELAGK